MKNKEGSGQGPSVVKEKPRPKSGEQLIEKGRPDEQARQERERLEALLRLSDKELALVRELKVLLEEDTLKDDKEAQDIIDERGYSASDRWNELHEEEDPEKKHEFSETSPRLINLFAYKVLKWLKQNGILTDNPDEKPIILELGSGYGNDALFFARNSKAHVTAVDKASVGILAAEEELRNPNREEYLGWIESSLESITAHHDQSFEATRAYLHSLVLQGRCTAKVIRKEMRIEEGEGKFKEAIARCIGRMNDAKANFATEDYRATLEGYERMGLQTIHSNSTLHYIPPNVLREEISPKIADVLRDKDGKPTGIFSVAMKLVTSASAQSPKQIKLSPDHPCNPSYDTIDKLVRIYPNTKEDIIALFPDFDVVECDVEDSPDYDKKGDTEKMCQLILRPKQGKAA